MSNTTQSSLENYVKCISGDETIWLPLTDAKLPLETLQANFPACTGLKYREYPDVFDSAWICVANVAGILQPPRGGWGKVTYCVVTPTVSTHEGHQSNREHCSAYDGGSALRE